MLSVETLARRLACTIAAFLLAAMCCLAVAAAPGARWASLAHTPFKVHIDQMTRSGTAFAQDHSGFIWMGTQTGLVRWDGYRVKRYAPDQQRTDALADGYVQTLHVDTRGALWVGTSSGGLARYNADQDNFSIYKPGPGALSDTRVSAIVGDGRGGIFVGTGVAIDQVDAHGALTPGTVGLLPAGGAESLLFDRGGVLWIGTRHGLFKRLPGAPTLHPVKLAPAGAREPHINALMQDSRGRIWIGSRTTGAYMMAAPGAPAQAVHESEGPDSLPGERVYSMVEVRPDEIWLGIEGGGIVAVTPSSGHTHRIRHQPDTHDSLPDDDPQAMFRERSGLIFVATNLGMSQFDPQPRLALTLRDTGTPLKSRLSVPSLLVRPDGKVWAAIPGGSIHIIDPSGKQPGEIRAGASGQANTLPKGRVMSMANGPDGAAFIGTQQGLFRADASGRQVRRVPIPTRNPSAAVWAMATRGNTLWIGGLDGLWELELDGAATRLVRHESARLGDSRVSAILPQDDGSVWVGTRVTLARLEAGGGQVEVLPTSGTDTTRMPQGYVSSLLVDKRKRLWVTTFGVGLSVLERTDSAGRRWFRRIGSADGLTNAGVNAALEDSDGIIWATTDEGLARIDPDSFALRMLGTAEGIPVAEYWTNSRGMGNHGELLFGGMTGLTILRPQMMSAWSYRPNVVLTQVRLNDKDLPAGRYNPGRQDGGAAPGPIEITPAARERGFALEFAALDFTSPERIQYAYRLVGFDAGWIATDASARRVSYNNLPPGDYTLQLRGSNRDGQLSEPLSVPVRVLPLWHQMGWVRLFMALLALTLLWALVQTRTALLRRRQRELQNMVEVRTAELRATQSQLETLAYADPLTGLPNRRVFNDELRRMSAQAARDGKDFTLLLIDLDHFKQVNDTLGHDAGDALLVAATGRLKLAVREVDRVVRLGGDEFAVLLACSGDAAVLTNVCRRIVEQMALPVRFGGQSMQVSASIGSASYSKHGGGPEALYKAADLALYRAKAGGRNRWCAEVQSIRA